MRFAQYLKEIHIKNDYEDPEGPSRVAMRPVLRFHDRIKNARWRMKQHLKRNDMIKALNDLHQLRAKLVDWHKKWRFKIGQASVAMPQYIRMGDQLITAAQKSIKEFDPPNFAQQADRALMNYHHAIEIAMGTRSAFK
jgi:hypothetical protein